MSLDPTAIRAPRGTTLRCKGWHQEAALRMLHNNLDPDVAENPDQSDRLRRHRPRRPRLAQLPRHRARPGIARPTTKPCSCNPASPVGIFRTHPESPRVLLANSNLVGHWSNWDEFNRLEKLGLTMYGQMTAGSWIYIGSQGIVQGTYETFAALARKHFDGSLAGKLVVSGGMGGMGGAQPLAATMNGARFLGIDVDPARIQRRLDTGYCDRIAHTLDEALAMLATPRAALRRPGGQLRRRPARDGAPRHRARRPHRPDQRPRSAQRLRAQRHDPRRRAASCARAIPRNTSARSMAAMAVHVEAMLAAAARPAPSPSITATTSAPRPKTAGVERAFDIPGFVPEYIRPLFCEGRGPFRWVALSGDPADIYRTDQLAAELSRTTKRWRAGSRWRASASSSKDCPRASAGSATASAPNSDCAINALVRTGELKAPIVIGRDHLDTGSVASPFRETEGMRDGCDAIADWPLLNALVNTAAGASWVSIHNGGGVGIGYSQHAGMVIVADGTAEMDRRLERVLTSDPGLGVVRHADAGYPEAIRFRRNPRHQAVTRPFDADAA